MTIVDRSDDGIFLGLRFPVVLRATYISHIVSKYIIIKVGGGTKLHLHTCSRMLGAADIVGPEVVREDELPAGEEGVGVPAIEEGLEGY